MRIVIEIDPNDDFRQEVIERVSNVLRDDVRQVARAELEAKLKVYFAQYPISGLAGDLLAEWLAKPDAQGHTPGDRLIHRFDAWIMETVSHTGRKRLDYILKVLAEDDLAKFDKHYRSVLSDLESEAKVFREKCIARLTCLSEAELPK